PRAAELEQLTPTVCPPSSSSSTQLGSARRAAQTYRPDTQPAKPGEQLDDRGRPPDIPPRAQPRDPPPPPAVRLPLRGRPISHGTGRGERHTVRATSRLLLEPHEHDRAQHGPGSPQQPERHGDPAERDEHPDDVDHELDHREGLALSPAPRAITVAADDLD